MCYTSALAFGAVPMSEADGFPEDRRLNDLLSDVQSDTLKEMETPFTYDAFQGDEGMHVQVRWMAIEDAE